MFTRLKASGEEKKMGRFCASVEKYETDLKYYNHLGRIICINMVSTRRQMTITTKFVVTTGILKFVESTKKIVPPTPPRAYRIITFCKLTFLLTKLWKILKSIMIYFCSLELIVLLGQFAAFWSELSDI